MGVPAVALLTVATRMWVAVPALTAIEPLGVGPQEPLHAGDQVGLRVSTTRKVIGHQTVGVNLPAGFAARCAQSPEEAFTVVVIGKNPLASIPAIHDVVNSARILNSQFARHAEECTIRSVVSTVITDPGWLPVGFKKMEKWGPLPLQERLIRTGAFAFRSLP